MSDATMSRSSRSSRSHRVHRVHRVALLAITLLLASGAVVAAVVTDASDVTDISDSTGSTGASDSLDSSDASPTTDATATPPPAPRAITGHDRCKAGPGPGCTCAQRPADPSTLANAPSCFPTYRAETKPLSPEQRERMTGVSWHEGCPVPLERLRSVTLLHWGFDGRIYEGELIVADSAAAAVSRAFKHLYDARFPIHRIQPVDFFGGSDARSMAANNTSAFNCRRIAGSQSVSRHAHGDAVDLNPVENPWVRGDGSTEGSVQPPAGMLWLDRDDVRPGMAVTGGAAVAAFDAVGWKWGGRWKRTRDYQHFSATGR